MADKRISQLIERTDIANNDVLPIVASGATTTNKVTISTIQEWMQDNLDVGVTSVGITIGTSGTDVSVSGSPITTSGNITINIPDASASARGVVSTGSQVFGGVKTFANGLSLPAVGGSNQITRIVNIGTLHEGTASLNQIGFNSGNNIYFGKGLNNGGVISWNNAAVRYYTLPDADGTIALTSQLDGYVTLNTTQTITAQKTFTTSGSTDSVIITHGSGSGIALDVIKAGNSEAIRVTKTSGTGNAVTISGGLLSAEAATLSGALNGTAANFSGNGTFGGDLQSSTRLIAATGIHSIIITPNLSGTSNKIETIGGLPLQISTDGSSLGLNVGGGSSQFSMTNTGASFTIPVTSNGQAATSPAIIVNNSVGTSGTAQHYINFTAGSTTIARMLRGNGASGLAADGLNIDNFGGFGIRLNQLGGSGGTFSVSGGAATFSSSVTATGGSEIPNGQFYRARRSSGSLLTDMIGIPSGTDDVRLLTTGDYNIVNGSLTNLMTIKNGGNVGIGTASPSDFATLTLVKNGASNYSGVNIGNSNSTANLYVGVGGSSVGNTSLRNNAYIMNAAASDLILGTADTERMRITSTGNVGIGTSTPSTTLDVRGTSTATIRVGSTGNGGSGDEFGNLEFYWGDPDAAEVKAKIYAKNVGNVGPTGGGAADLLFATTPAYGSSTERMRIRSDGQVQPGADNSYGLGGSGIRWANVWAANGTIQTSDEREKKDIVDSDLGLDFVNQLRPVSFKWKVGQNVVTSEVVKDEEGNPILDGEGNEKTESVITPREGKRTHYGLIAQEVEKLLDGKDFGGFIHDEETDIKGLRYDQFVPVLIKAVQEQQEQIKSLTEQVEALKSQING